jgi:exopolysaccharide biosynthesis polyprenyl glycosylphosphotransferase
VIRRHTAALHLALVLTDAMLAIALFIGLSVVRFGPDRWRETWDAAGLDGVLAATAYALILVTLLWIRGLYRLRVRWSPRREAVDILFAIMILAVVVFTALFILKLPNVSRLFLLVLFPAQAILTITVRTAIRLAFVHARTQGYNLRYLLIVGANAGAAGFADAVARHRELGLQPIGHLASPHDRANGAERHTRRPILGDISDIEDILHGSVVDEVAICLTIDDLEVVEPIARLCEDEGRVVRIPMFQPGPVVPGGTLEEFDGIQVLSLVYGPDRTIGMVIKRALDVALASAALVALAPLLLAVALVIRHREGPPVLFRQTRLGLHGRPFQVVKFRTMIPDAEERLAELAQHNEISGPAFKLTDDPRLTRTGRWLRSTSIDELPQLLNVLRGEMSLVGPRPPLPREVDAYDIWHRRRLSMQPGITGLWQVVARRDPDFDRWVRLDLDYIDRWSLWLDLKIMLRTIPAMLAGEGR